jgi:hypothetical protein
MGDMFKVLVALWLIRRSLSMWMSSLVTLAQQTWLGSQMGLLLACSRRGRDYLRQLVNNVEELRDRIGLYAYHQDSAANSEGLAIRCAQGDVRSGDPYLDV